MKFLSLVFVIGLLLSGLTYAQRNDSGTVTLGNGRNIVRINIGDDRDDRDMLMRIRRLEQAVRDLQEQVYNIPTTRMVHTCTADVFSIGMVLGNGNNLEEAKANAMRDCQSKGGGIFCKERELRCSSSEQRN